MTKHLTDKETTQVIVEYLQGATMQRLGTKYGRSHAAISKLLTRRSIEARGKHACQKPKLGTLKLTFPTEQPSPGLPSLPPLVGRVGKLVIAAADPEIWHVQSLVARYKISHAEATNYMIRLKEFVEQRGDQLLLLWKTELTCPGLQTLCNHKAGHNPRVCSARETQVAEVALPDANEFYEQNHLQGRVNLGHTLGLTFRDRLVACMTLARGNICRGDASAELLSRFAAVGPVPGSASKLLKHHRKAFPGKDVISYSDERYAPTGALYNILGFEKYKTYKPDYRYWRDGRWYAKSSKQKKHLRAEYTSLGLEVPLSKTEFEMATELGYKRCYDCGKLSWRLYAE